MYIYENREWPHFTWKSAEILKILGEVRHLQGKLIEKMSGVGFKLQNEAYLATLSSEIVKSSEIEGDILDFESVRSSVARHLGIEYAGVNVHDRSIDGIVEMMLDISKNYKLPLTKKRLFGWHAALFPTGYSGIQEIPVAQWRDDSNGPMQIISGTFTRKKVHFQAPSAEKIESEMSLFFDWVNMNQEIDDLIKAAVAHLWFVTIHPFEDGNGRIGRAISDLYLASSDNIHLRFYSMSTQIYRDKKEYYQILERTQKGDLDITPWIKWFLNCLYSGMKHSHIVLDKVLSKSVFWSKLQMVDLNSRQRKIINILLDDSNRTITTSKYAKIVKCSHDTALRDIKELLKQNIFRKSQGKGRSTSYFLCT